MANLIKVVNAAMCVLLYSAIKKHLARPLGQVLLYLGIANPHRKTLFTMFSRASLATISLHLLAQAPTVSAALENSTECVDVHFMVARGSTLAYPGFPCDVFESVAANMTATTNYENIIYPATDETDTDSYFLGRAAAGAQVNAYTEACPDSKIVLGSYSQGCLIVGDALAGGGGQEYLGNATEPLITEASGKNSMSWAIAVRKAWVLFEFADWNLLCSHCQHLLWQTSSYSL